MFGASAFGSAAFGQGAGAGAPSGAPDVTPDVEILMKADVDAILMTPDEWSVLETGDIDEVIAA